MTQVMLQVADNNQQENVFFLELNNRYIIKSVATPKMMSKERHYNNSELAKRLVQQRTMYQLQKYLTECTNLKFKLLEL